MSEDLQAHLIEQIHASGKELRFDQYMEQALYDPQWGYYERVDPIMGREGDFVTAPELGKFMAQGVAKFCTEALAALGCRAVAEYGPGTGKLAEDVLAACDSIDSYHLIDRSESLRQKQRTRLSENPAAHACTKLPDPFEGVVIANEVLDAMPARLFWLGNGLEGAREVRERMVKVAGDDLAWGVTINEGLAQELKPVLAELDLPLEQSYHWEWRHDAVSDWLEELERCRRGMVLIVDYGYSRKEYYHPQRTEGTLHCYGGQGSLDPLQQPGRRDISIDVDFTTVAEQAHSRGWEVLMFTTQAGFLLEYGVHEAMEAPVGSAARLAQRAQMEVLLHPQHMGEHFKVMVLGRDCPLELPHRICPDHRGRL